MKKEDIVQIFENLGFTIANIGEIGPVVEMNAKDAFLFSVCTGAKYMLYQNGITMKGRFEVFIHRGIFANNSLIYSPGLFSRDINGKLTEGNSSTYLKEQFPTIFTGTKKVLIYDMKDGEISNVESKVYNFLAAQAHPDEFVLYKNLFANDLGESFQEYLASLYFIRLGYLVENQVPWFQQNLDYHGIKLQGGIPDFSAFHCSAEQLLYKAGYINELGVHLSMIPVMSLFKEHHENSESKDYLQYEFFVGEAKANSNSFSAANEQLEKYSKVNLANSLFTILPKKSSKGSVYNSFFLQDHKIEYLKNKDFIVDKAGQDNDDIWLSTYIKMLMLGNIKFDSILAFITDYRVKNSLETHSEYEAIHLLDAVQNTNNDDFYNYFKGGF